MKNDWPAESNLKLDGKTKGGLTAIAPFGIAVLVPFACPACWPAYIGLMASLGIVATSVVKFLFPLTAFFLLLSLIPLWVQGRSQKNYGPFFLGTLAAVITLLGMFAIVFWPLLYAGVALLVTASIWSLRLGKKEDGEKNCPTCVQNEEIS